MDGSPPKTNLTRRKALSWLASLFAIPSSAGPITDHRSPITPFAKVVPGYEMQFPRDEGSHPEFRLEWWYITGWLEEAGMPLGFQITFFRARPNVNLANPSRFAPRHILIAHAALSDPAPGRLMHAQLAARSGFGLAGADEGRTRIWIDDWRLQQEGTGYHAWIPAPDFTLELAFTASQPPLLQGDGGFSRKGPAPTSASYYYSLPHLQVRGAVTRRGKPATVAGTAWLDHEWSSQYLDGEAVGWDWIGINLDGGDALMAFRMRGTDGGSIWAGGTLRRVHGVTQAFGPGEVRFTARREWRSGRTGTNYPVAWRVTAGGIDFEIEPLFDDQENDARASTGTIYWEGAVRALREGKPAGRGYLELTGYWRRVNR